MQLRVRVTEARTILAIALTLSGAACTGTSAPLAPSSGAWRFTGSVSTVAGAPISGAQLAVQDGPNKGVQATSDALGGFTFDGLESGRFTVIIAAPGFISAAPVVDLYRDLDVHFALRPSF